MHVIYLLPFTFTCIQIFAHPLLCYARTHELIMYVDSMSTYCWIICVWRVYVYVCLDVRMHVYSVAMYHK